MKKTITFFAIVITSCLHSQSYTETFESFTLNANSAYTSTTSTPFQGISSVFEHQYDTTYHIWDGGFSYTNKYDSATAGYGNLYGVKPLKGYNQSNIYVIGQDRGIIRMKAPYKGVEGMYLTNTTYDYKSMKNGDAFAKKFGGTSGNDPDYFKITIKGYLAGVMKTDSVEFYLADFRNSNNALDYIVSSWQWVNTMTLGEIDSLKFFMYSSDMGSFGINTPLFFGLDNLTASPSFVGITKNTNSASFSVFPNPAVNELTISRETNSPATLQLLNTNGGIVKEAVTTETTHKISIAELPAGIYFLKISDEQAVLTKKIVKQ